MLGLRVAGMVGLVLLGMVMGGVVHAGLNALGMPSSTGDSGFYNGNEIRDATSQFRVGYVSGVTDAFSAIVQERKQIGISSVAPPGVEQAVWDESESDYKWEVANGQTMTKVVFSIFLPSGVTNYQLADVVDQYISDHPAERHNSAALLVWRALTEVDWE